MSSIVRQPNLEKAQLVDHGCGDAGDQEEDAGCKEEEDSDPGEVSVQEIVFGVLSLVHGRSMLLTSVSCLRNPS